MNNHKKIRSAAFARPLARLKAGPSVYPIFGSDQVSVRMISQC